MLGTGYLGATHAVCMAELGFEVIGLDVDETKVAKLAAGEPVVVVGCDQPFVSAELLTRLAQGGAVRAGGRIEPFPARYEPEWLPELRDALEREAPVRATLEALGPATIEWDDDAAARMKRIPAFVRGMVVRAVEDSCRRNSISRVTVDELERIRARMPTPKFFA